MSIFSRGGIKTVSFHYRASTQVSIDVFVAAAQKAGQRAHAGLANLGLESAGGARFRGAGIVQEV